MEENKVNKLLAFEERMNNLSKLQFEYTSAGTFTLSPQRANANEKFTKMDFILTAQREDAKTGESKRVKLAHINMLRIPSNLHKSQNLGKEYDITEAMHSAHLGIVADALQLGRWGIPTKPTHSIDIFDALLFSDLYYIEELVVEKEFRNNGLGSAIIDAIPLLIEYYNGGDEVLLTLMMVPIEEPTHKNWDEAYAKLEAFYRKNNFVMLNNNVCAKRA